MKTPNKGIISIPIILFSVILVLALAGGGYYWFQNQQNKIKTTAPTAPQSQKNEWISFDIKSTPTSFEKVDISVITNKDGSRYSFIAESSAGDIWNFSYTPEMVCFKKQTFSNYYCGGVYINEKPSPAERIAAGLAPGNAFAAFSSRIELALEKLADNSLTDGTKLSFKDANGKIFEIGVAQNLKNVSSGAELVENGIDLVKLADYCLGLGICPGENLESAINDSGITDYAKEQKLNLDDFRINQSQSQQSSPQPVAGVPQISPEQKRDAQRISDLSAIKSAIVLYLVTTNELSPFLCNDGVIHRSITGSTTVDGTGWLPINFEKTQGGSPLAKLYLDPLNDAGHYYSYACDPQTQTFELGAKMESNTYKDLSAEDGGNNPNIYEVGTNLEIIH